MIVVYGENDLREKRLDAIAMIGVTKNGRDESNESHRCENIPSFEEKARYSL
jgi:hypothetical protein